MCVSPGAHSGSGQMNLGVFGMSAALFAGMTRTATANHGRVWLDNAHLDHPGKCAVSCHMNGTERFRAHFMVSPGASN